MTAGGAHAALRAVLVSILCACQPTYGFRFLNPSPARRVVQLLQAPEGDTTSTAGNEPCAGMRAVRSPVGVVDTVHVMPDSSLTVMIAFGSTFQPAARYCLIAHAQGSRRADTLYLPGSVALEHTRRGVLTVQLYPVLQVVRTP